jgi:hypothetical protein
MSNELNYFSKHLEVLYINCFQGILHIKLWKDLDKNLKGNDALYKKYDYFWLTTLKANLEAAQLHLLKLFDKPKDSVNIDKLVKYAEKNNEKIFEPKDNYRLEVEINQFESEIEKFKETIENLKNIRNNQFVHLSKKYADDYDALYKDYPNSRKNIHEILLICGELLTTFKKLAFNESKMMIIGSRYQIKEIVKVLSEKLE